MRNRDVIEFLGLWERLHNPDFKPLEFEGFRNQAGANAFTMSPKKWIDATQAIGIISKSGRYGGTFAHSDIAFEFASWISPEFKLYIIKDYRRLKYEENSRLSLNWNLNREISKLNYHIHTDAIKSNLIPPELTPEQISFTYASEADLLNVALFGKTAKQWRTENPDTKGNIRDHATHAFDQYVKTGGMSGAYPYKEQDERYKYIEDVFDTLIVRDIREKRSGTTLAN